MRTINMLLAVLVAAAFTGVAHAQSRPGSIYDPSRGPIGLVQDKTARRVGDLVTVIVFEEADISSEDSADSTKATNLNYELANFDLKADAFDVLPGLAANSSDSFSGSAQIDKRDTFEARVTAMVVDVLPNGNLVLNGRREIRVENQTKLIEFSGVVRKFDVTSANTVSSSMVADARISYVGSGPSTKATQRRGFGAWIHDALDWLWPF
jgi:flagellar L-ring protein precursor FlgH